MYENACRLMAKQTVALEVLSYHATAQKEETEKLVVCVSWTILLSIYDYWKGFMSTQAYVKY